MRPPPWPPARWWGSNLPNLLLILGMCALAAGPAGLPAGVMSLVLVFLVWQVLAWTRVRPRLPG